MRQVPPLLMAACVDDGGSVASALPAAMFVNHYFPTIFLYTIHSTKPGGGKHHTSYNFRSMSPMERPRCHRRSSSHRRNRDITACLLRTSNQLLPSNDGVTAGSPLSSPWQPLVCKTKQPASSSAGIYPWITCRRLDITTSIYLSCSLTCSCCQICHYEV